MMRRKLFSLLLLAAISQGSYADDYTNFLLVKNDNTTTVLTAVGTKITFSGTNLVATSGSDAVTIPLTSMSYMVFSNASTGISQTQVAQGAVVSAYNGTISVRTDESASVLVCNSAGQIMGTARVEAGQTTAVASGLTSGVYIVKVNNESYKTVVR